MKHRNRKPWRAALLLLGAVLLPGGPARGAAPEPPPEADRVRPGDTLEVTYWHEDGVPREVKVDARGLVSLPALGMVPVKGLSVAEVAARVTEMLRQLVKHPRVTVSLRATRPQVGVYVLGAVGRAGPYEFFDGMRVKDALGLAGGLAPGADAARATLNNAAQGTRTLDARRAIAGDADANLELTSGDLIHVPARDAAAANLVILFVVGQVARPGSTSVAPGARLSDAITAAGGPTAMAALRRATLARKGETLPLDLDKILRKGDLAGNLPVQEGDVLLIPEQRNQVTLVGEFQRPGTYPFREGDTLTAAVALGGGPTPAADLEGALLTRGGEQTPVDLNAMLKEGDLKGDRPLQDGDVLVLPLARREVTLLGEFQRPGTYPFAAGNSLAQAVALGGGPTADADLRRAVLKRAGKETPVDLYAMLKEGELKEDRELQGSDVLVIPSGVRIYAYGAFQKPGPIVVTEGMKLVDVLLAAGGTAKEARLDKACVARMVNGKPEKIPVDLKAILKAGAPGVALQFAAGDVLYLPEKGKALNWQGALSAVYLLSVVTDQVFR